MLKNILFCIVCLWLEFNCIQNFIWKRCLEKKTEKKEKEKKEKTPTPGNQAEAPSPSAQAQ